MKTKFLSAGLLFSVVLLLFSSCKGRTIEANNSTLPNISTLQHLLAQQEAKPWIVISQEKGILYQGNTIDTQTFKQYLRDSLTTLALNRELPIEVPIVYEGEVKPEQEQEIQLIIQEATQIARSMVGLQLSNRMK